MEAQFEKGMVLLSQLELTERRDALGVAVWSGHAFVGHPFSGGFSVIDVRDPRSPSVVAVEPPPPGTTSLHLQVHDDILLLGQEADDPTVKELGLDRPTGKAPGEELAYSPGLGVFDVSIPERPEPIGFMEIDGFGVHRVWWEDRKSVV